MGKFNWCNMPFSVVAPHCRSTLYNQVGSYLFPSVFSFQT